MWPLFLFILLSRANMKHRRFHCVVNLLVNAPPHTNYRVFQNRVVCMEPFHVVFQFLFVVVASWVESWIFGKRTKDESKRLQKRCDFKFGSLETAKNVL